MIYKGSEPPPDTFKDDAQALAEGTYGRDGVFHATFAQAKCASKYAPAQPGAASLLPPRQAGSAVIESACAAIPLNARPLQLTHDRNELTGMTPLPTSRGHTLRPA